VHALLRPPAERDAAGLREGLPDRVDQVRVSRRAAGRRDKRIAALQTAGFKKAQLYGRDATVYGGLNAFFLLMDRPEVYKLPDAQSATLPKRNNLPGYAGGLVTAVIGLIAGALAFRSQRMNEKT
jgi:hypothetical protein